jgi:hypothetical protein
MAAKFTRMIHKIVMQLHLVADSCTICSFRSRRPVRKLLDTPSYYISGSRNSSVSVVTRLRVGRPGYESEQGEGFFFRHRLQTDSAARPTSYQVVIGGGGGALSPRLKRLGPEADHSLPSSAETKKAGSYTSSLHTSTWRGVSLRKGNSSWCDS